MRNEYPLYLNGAWTPQTDGCVREDIEPATASPSSRCTAPALRW